MSLAQGERVGHYKILAMIGKGGMGEVYRARDTKLGRDVAIKVLPDGIGYRSGEAGSCFEQEARSSGHAESSGISPRSTGLKTMPLSWNW